MIVARGSLVLDSGGVSALAEGNPRARAVLVRARRENRDVVIPAPVLTETYTGRRDHAAIDRVLNDVSRHIETTPERAKQAGVLRARFGIRDVVDAIVMAEAVAAGAAIILTSDPGDLERLRDAAGLSKHDVGIIGV